MSTRYEPPAGCRDVLAIVGSTKFATPGAVDQARGIILAVFDRCRPDTVVSGGADGIDTLGVELARAAGIETIEHLPKVRAWASPGGFRDRNQLIVRDCTRLLRIVCHASKTYGSGWTADQAEKLGKVVWRVTL